MKQISSWETDSRSAGKDIPRLFWNPKVHCSVHNIPPLSPALSHLNIVHTIIPYFFKISFIIILASTAAPPSDLFFAVIPTKVLYT
jgi:hypothetical protein